MCVVNANNALRVTRYWIALNSVISSAKWERRYGKSTTYSSNKIELLFRAGCGYTFRGERIEILWRIVQFHRFSRKVPDVRCVRAERARTIVLGGAVVKVDAKSRRRW